MRATRRTGAALAVLLLCGLAGCADDGSGAWTEVEDGRLRVDRPTAWSAPVPVEAPWTAGFTPGEGAVEQLQVSGDFGDHTSAAQGMGTLVGQAQVGLRGFTVVESRDVEIEGATTGRLTRYTFTDNGGSQLTGTWVVAARWPSPQSVAVSFLTPQPDPELERRVLESLVLDADG
ncbi:hypothetical protein ACFFOM_12080 [Microlunatus capsulatus]|uniref:Uncharacterized protein n=1 Tax=Microlunatus capsulatus TaxID=99117 RepID=A0ABS4Z8Z1_9ACTN|nr:hypothetical protein [Microlunatus capsulatus]MBP2417517.1 hypothetical protein [Microlunatus capsulatus]